MNNLGNQINLLMKYLNDKDAPSFLTQGRDCGVMEYASSQGTLKVRAWDEHPHNGSSFNEVEATYSTYTDFTTLSKVYEYLHEKAMKQAEKEMKAEEERKAREERKAKVEFYLHAKVFGNSIAFIKAEEC